MSVRLLERADGVVVLRPGCGCVLELRERQWRRVRKCGGPECRAQVAARRGPYKRRV